MTQLVITHGVTVSREEKNVHISFKISTNCTIDELALTEYRKNLKKKQNCTVKLKCRTCMGVKIYLQSSQRYDRD